jgi:glucokinase-like ROK family protein
MDQPDGGAPLLATTVGSIFKIIRDQGPLFPADIVRQTGLAKSTVSGYVDRLLSAGLIRDEVKPGGKRRMLKVAESAGCVVGVDLGQTHLQVGLCDLQGDILDSIAEPVVLLHETPESILARVAEAVCALCSRNALAPAALSGIGFGLPGPVDYAKGFSVSPPVMPGWDRFPIATMLRRQFTCPVVVDNDVNVLALAERDKGLAAQERDFLYIKVGSGIGAGLVVDGRIYRGARGAAGDIGHIRVDEDTTLCHCGNRGCLEAVAGGRALAISAAEAARSGTSSFLSERLAKGVPITCELVGRGAAGGDEECLRIIIGAGKALGDVLAKMVNFFNPSLIVMGGGLSGLGERYVASIREAIYRRSTPLATSDLVIKRSALGASAGLIGSAILVLDEIFSLQNVGRLMGPSGQVGNQPPKSASSHG